jgi:hypothetical protein
MSEEHPKDSIYITDDTFESTINGVTFVWREVSGTEVVRLMGNVNDTDIDKIAYIKKLIKLCIVEPVDLDIDKLKSQVLGQLMATIEDSLGLSQVMQKNWKKRSDVIQSSTQLPTSIKFE